MKKNLRKICSLKEKYNILLTTKSNLPKQFDKYFIEQEPTEKTNSYLQALDLAHQIKDYPNLITGLEELGKRYELSKDSKGNFKLTQAIMCYNSALNLLKDKKEENCFDNPDKIKLRLINNIVEAETEFLTQVKNINAKTYLGSTYSCLAQKNNIKIDEHLMKLDKDKLSNCTKYIKQITENKKKLFDLRKYCYEELKKEEVKKLEYHISKHNRAGKIEELFEYIRTEIKDFMQRLIKECAEVLGDPPCNYSVIAFGSLARGEMTPYSDLEFGILIDDQAEKLKEGGIKDYEKIGKELNEKNKEYFRNLTKLLEIRVINLGETRIRGSRTDMPELDKYFKMIRKEGFLFDPTIKGFTFDPGRKTPLGKEGKYELIGIPHEIARYVGLEGEKIEKNLPWVVHNGWLLYSGNPSDQYVIKLDKQDTTLINQYKAEVKINLEISSKIKSRNINKIPLYKSRSVKLLKKNIEEFTPYNIMKQEKEGQIFRTKMEIYRLGTILIDNLALYYGKVDGTTFEKIEYLSNTNVNGPNLFNSQAKSNIKKSVAIANELRLQTYLKNKAQKEIMHIVNEYKFSTNFNSIEKPQMLSGETTKKQIKDLFFITNLDPKTSSLFQFYYVMFPLIKYLGELCGNKLYVEEKYNDLLMIFTERVLAKMIKEDVGKKYHDFFDNSKLNEGIVYKRLMKYKKAKESLNGYISQHKNSIIGLCLLGHVLDSLGEFKKSKEMHERVFEKSRLTYSKEDSIELAGAYNNLGNILIKLGQFKKAKKNFEKAIGIQKNFYRSERHLNIARSYTNLGVLQLELGEYTEALKNHKKALDIYQENHTEKHIDVAAGYSNLGIIQIKLKDFKTAKEYFEKSLEIKMEICGTDEHVSVIYDLINFGCLLRESKVYEEARKYFIKALKLSYTVFRTKKHPVIARIYHNLGTSYRGSGMKKKALEYIKKSIRMKIDCLGTELHLDIAIGYNTMGNLLFELNQCRGGEIYYEKSIEIKKIIYETENHPSVAITYNNLKLLLSTKKYPREEKNEIKILMVNKEVIKRRLFYKFYKEKEKLEESIKLDGENLKAKIQLAKLYLYNLTEKDLKISRKKRISTALKYFFEAAKQNKVYIPDLIEAGDYLYKKQTLEAVKDAGYFYSKVWKHIDKANSQAHKKMGLVYLCLVEKFCESTKLLQKAKYHFIESKKYSFQDIDDLLLKALWKKLKKEFSSVKELSNEILENYWEDFQLEIAIEISNGTSYNFKEIEEKFKMKITIELSKK